MDWQSAALLLLSLASTSVVVNCWSGGSNNIQSTHKTKMSPYIDLVICPFRTEAWQCARQQSARILDIWDDELLSQWQKLKVEADRQLNATIEKRGYSESETLTKEKPSTILKKIEIGTNYMKGYLTEAMDGFLGREYEYMHSGKLEGQFDDDENATQETDETDSENDDDNDGDGESGDEDEKGEDVGELQGTGDMDNGDGDGNKFAVSHNDASNGFDEFIEIDDATKQQQLRKKGGGNKKGKPGHSEPATLVVVKPFPIEHDDHGHSGGKPVFSGGGHGGHGGKPLKQKRKKRKKQKPGSDIVDTVVVEHEPSGSLALDLLDELVQVDSGGKKKKHPTKYGRSNGVTRGKKKKKKKAIAKLVLIGTFLKAKIELLLKLLGAHLQIKFFAIALIGLLINIARFWIDVKRGGTPQKVVYVEHAHHQHHYEDHGDDWGGGEQGGSYWKRSLQTDPTIEEDGYTDSYQPQPQSQFQSQQDAHYLAYRNQWQ